MYVPETPSITKVTVSPATAAAKAGQSVSLSADVETVGFASQEVNWTVTTGTYASTVTVDKAGNVKIAATAAAGKCVITATSVVDNTKSGTCEITITAA